jgi:hypothetical protein
MYILLNPELESCREFLYCVCAWVLPIRWEDMIKFLIITLKGRLGLSLHPIICKYKWLTGSELGCLICKILHHTFKRNQLQTSNNQSVLGIIIGARTETKKLSWTRTRLMIKENTNPWRAKRRNEMKINSTDTDYWRNLRLDLSQVPPDPDWPNCKIPGYQLTVYVTAWYVVCMCGTLYAYRFVCIPMLFKSRNRIQIKTKCKMLMLFLDQNLMFFPMVHLFLLFNPSLILCTGKWISYSQKPCFHSTWIFSI